MWWIHAEFVGREEILNFFEQPPSLPLSPEQIARVIAFGRKHYKRIGSLVVHKLTEKNIGRSTLVSRLANLRQIQFPFTYFNYACNYVSLIILIKSAEDLQWISSTL